MSTIIMKVHLDCRLCYKKISKTIRKLQERENIQTVTFDDKNNTVTISGLFDPKKLIKKLCCKACEVIKDIQIKEKEKKTEEKKPEAEKPGPGCNCGCRPWYWGYYGDYKCSWCGRGYGWVPAGPSPPVYVYGAPYGGY